MYKILLLENGISVKTLYTYDREGDAKNRINRIKGKKSFLPKISLYKNKKLIPVKLEAILIRPKKEYDKDLPIFQEDPGYVIMVRCDYEIDDVFIVNGTNRKLNAKEVVDHVIMSDLSEYNIKQIFILNNRLIIEGIQLHVVTCKNKKEAIRFYNRIRSYVFVNKINYIAFFDEIKSKREKSIWYDKINRIVGVSYNRLYRTSSR